MMVVAIVDDVAVGAAIEIDVRGRVAVVIVGVCTVVVVIGTVIAARGQHSGQHQQGG